MRFAISTLSLVLMISQWGYAGQCSVEILSERMSGEKIRVAFKSTLKTQKECQELAKLHRPNFAPHSIRSKTVAWNWQGPAKSRSKSVAIAKRSHRSRIR